MRMNGTFAHRRPTLAGLSRWTSVAGAATSAAARFLGASLAMSLGLGFALAPADVHAQIRCWTNESGTRECSDLPPPPNAKGVNEVRGRAGRIEGQESFAQRQAADRFPVTLWSNDCGEPCTNARKLLASRGVPFTDRNPALPGLQEEFKRMTKGQMQVPLLIVGTSTLVGFEEGQWNSTLDAAGYARTPTGRRPATQAAAPQAARTAPDRPSRPVPAAWSCPRNPSPGRARRAPVSRRCRRLPAAPGPRWSRRFRRPALRAAVRYPAERNTLRLRCRA
jgi:hypothetical protein